MQRIQILLIAFFCFALVKAVLRFRQKAITFSEMLAWVMVWLFSSVIVVWPNSTTPVAHFLGIGRGSDLVLYVGVAAAFFMLFRLLVKTEKLEREITVLTREIALLEKQQK